MLEKYSDEMVLEAVKGMIPKNHLGSAVLRKLFVYADEGKAHEAQSPITLTL
jgi:large subunit ribosomal protein L13